MGYRRESAMMVHKATTRRRMASSHRQRSTTAARALVLIAAAGAACGGCTEENSDDMIAAAVITQASFPSASGTDAAAVEVSYAAAGYVDDALCAECHREIAQTYQHVGMAKSLYRWQPDTAVEDFKKNHYFHEPSNQHFEMTQRDERFVLVRYQLDDRGARINVREQAADWVIGSGAHARGYLYRAPSGEVFEFPIVFYTQEKKWAMAPGYDRPDHEGFNRPATRTCLFCHNGYPNVDLGSDQFGKPHLFPQTLPQGTGCQRCHGPGAQHIRISEQIDATLQQVQASITNPAHLEPRRRDDVCFQCHLQPTSKLSSFMRCFGRDDYSFRPGEALENYLVHLDFGEPSTRSERFEINHHPYRLRQSTCFIKSQGAINCLTCHDVHRKIPPEQRKDHYRDACLTCHTIDDCGMHGRANEAPSAVADDDCVACHMPPRRTQDAVHIVMTDHRIQRVPGASEELLAPLAEQPSPHGSAAAAEVYFADRVPEQRQRDLYEAMAEVNDGNIGAIGKLERAIAAAHTEAVEPRVALGVAHLHAGNTQRAALVFQAIVQQRPDLALAHANLGLAVAAAGNHEQAIEHFRKAIELEPNVPDARYNMASTFAKLGRSDEAIEQYREAIGLRPNYPAAHFNLGNILARRERYDEAAEEFRAALVHDPNMDAAYRNLGLALRRMDDWFGAIGLWSFGLSRRPDDFALMVELAQARLAATDPSLRDAKTALELSQHARSLAPRHGEAAVTFAAALLANERWGEAVAAADRARELGGDPLDCDLIAALAQDAGESGPATRLRVTGLLNDARPASAEPSVEPVRAWLLELAMHRLEGQD